MQIAYSLIVPGISMSCKCECYMQIQYTMNLNPGRFELSITDIWSIAYFLAKIDLFSDADGNKPDTRFLLLGNGLLLRFNLVRHYHYHHHHHHHHHHHIFIYPRILE